MEAVPNTWMIPQTPNCDCSKATCYRCRHPDDCKNHCNNILRPYCNPYNGKCLEGLLIILALLFSFSGSIHPCVTLLSVSAAALFSAEQHKISCTTSATS